MNWIPWRDKTAPEPKRKALGVATATPALWNVLQLWDGTLASYGVIYRKLAPVRTVVDFIASAVSTTPLKVYRREPNGRPEARDSGLARLLREPNPALTPKQLIFSTVADRAVYGNAYWRKMRTDGRRVSALVPLPPYRVTPKNGDLLGASEYEFWNVNGTAPITIPASDIVHFKTYDPEDPRVGSSKLEALRTVLLEEVEASRHRKGFWQNFAQVALGLETDEYLTDDQFARLQTQFENRYVGGENAGKTAIVEKGRLVPISTTARDAEFVAGRVFVLEATARVYNVPLPVLSLTDQATYASQQEFRKAIYQDLLPEWFEDIQAQIELQLLPEFGDSDDLYVEFAVEGKLRGDFLDQASILNTAIGRPWMVVREGRNLQNLEDRGVEEDDELVVPVGPNYALEGAAAAPVAPVVPLPRSALAAFFDRQERSVTSRKGAGHSFDRERWNRELSEIVAPEIAEKVNAATEVELAAGEDPRDVFERRRAGG